MTFTLNLTSADLQLKEPKTKSVGGFSPDLEFKKKKKLSGGIDCLYIKGLNLVFSDCFTEQSSEGWWEILALLCLQASSEQVLTGPEPQNPALPLPAFLSGTSLLFLLRILVLKGPNPTGFHGRILFFEPPGSNLLRPPVGFLTGPADSSGVDSWCFTRLFSVGFNQFPPCWSRWAFSRQNQQVFGSGTEQHAQLHAGK